MKANLLAAAVMVATIGFQTAAQTSTEFVPPEPGKWYRLVTRSDPEGYLSTVPVRDGVPVTSVSQLGAESTSSTDAKCGSEYDDVIWMKKRRTCIGPSASSLSEFIF